MAVSLCLLTSSPSQRSHILALWSLAPSRYLLIRYPDVIGPIQEHPKVISHDTRPYQNISSISRVVQDTLSRTHTMTHRTGEKKRSTVPSSTRFETEPDHRNTPQGLASGPRPRSLTRRKYILWQNPCGHQTNHPDRVL